MNVFEVVKQSVTTREVAEFYGFSVNRAGMIACPFHNDRTPSMKVDKRFHCFGCGADGDAVDFIARLFDKGTKEAAEMIATDFPLLMTETASRLFCQRRENPQRSRNLKQRKTVLPCTVRLLPQAPSVGKGLRTEEAGGRMASAVCGSSAQARLY